VGNGEIGITAKMFNRMSLRLRASLEEIQNKNSFLKEEIAKRQISEERVLLKLNGMGLA
jgi:hypothetical protein